jgi:hypothetical protein
MDSRETPGLKGLNGLKGRAEAVFAIPECPVVFGPYHGFGMRPHENGAHGFGGDNLISPSNSVVEAAHLFFFNYRRIFTSLYAKINAVKFNSSLRERNARLHTEEAGPPPGKRKPLARWFPCSGSPPGSENQGASFPRS